MRRSSIKVVSISPYIPFSGIDHGGGELFRRHTDLLARDHELVVVAPAEPRNVSALRRDSEVSYRRLLLNRSLDEQRVGRVAAVARRVVPFLPGGPFARALLTDERAMEALRDAERIELQWFATITLVSRLRKAFPDVPIIGVFHDVVSQGQRRRLTTPRVPLRSRVLALVRLALAVLLERRVMRVLDTAVVLSDKDAALLARRGGTARTVVLHPPLDEAGMPTRSHPTPPCGAEVLFVGALGRPHNEDAVRWLLSDIWPRVVTAVPGARLTIAGGGPSDALREAVSHHSGVLLTGYVPSLADCYSRAVVVVAPLRLGAGVKLKCVTAMLWGVPVVATTVGADEIGGRDVFVAIEDDPERFAAAVIGVLREPASAADVSARALEWARARYFSGTYRHALGQLYG